MCCNSPEGMGFSHVQVIVMWRKHRLVCMGGVQSPESGVESDIYRSENV